MARRIQFLLHLLWMVPLMPVLYLQGKRLRDNFPDLPEPEDIQGINSGPESAGDPLKILILGESTMAAVGARSHKQSFAGALAKTLSQSLNRAIQWKVHAQSGISLKRLSAELLPQIKETEVQLIVIGMGANDAFHLNPPFQWCKQAKSLTQQLRTKFPEAEICYCSMPPIKDFTAFSPIMKTVVGQWSRLLGQELKDYTATEENVYFDSRQIHLDSWVQHLPKGGTIRDLFSDGVHPSEIAYRIWGKEMARFIIKSTQLGEDL